MVDQNKIEIRHGQALTVRVWSLIEEIEDQIKGPLWVTQGGFKGEDGAEASAGTHNKGDVFDFSLRDLSESQQLEANYLLRYWNGCSWLRKPEYGWTSTGPHGHCVMRDSHYGLSTSARSQVALYDKGLNGLANNGKDPFKRPPEQHHYDMEEFMALSDEDLDKIANRVWNYTIIRAWDGTEAKTKGLLNSAHFYAVLGGGLTTVPATSTAGVAGKPTSSAQILAAASNDSQGTPGGSGSLSDADKQDIAVRVADLLSARLKA